MTSLLHQWFAPVVAVSASDSVNAILLNNGFVSLSDFFSPFCHPLPHPVQVRDVNGQIREMEEFHLRLRQVDALGSTSTSGISIKMTDYLTKMPGSNKIKVSVDRFIKNQKQSEDDQEEATSQPQKGIPRLDWSSELTEIYDFYRDLVCFNYELSEHESFNYPLAAILAISTHDTSPVPVINSLFSSVAPLKPFSKGYMDPNIPKFIVIFHDTRSSMNLDAVLVPVQKMYGAQNVHVIPINTVQDEAGEYRNSVLWKDYFRKTARSDMLMDDALWQVEFGRYIADKDLEETINFLDSFTKNCLVPNMERNIQQWNEQIASPRKGITNRLFNVGRKYFGGSSKSTNQTITSTDEKGNLIYTYTSPESILRRLADYTFMLRDYGFALSIYEVVKKDFSGSDKASKYLAGVQEMMSICSIIQDGLVVGANDIYIQSAMANYRKSSSTYFETRSAMLFYEVLSSKQQYIDATNLFQQILKEDTTTDLRGAILAEQCALSFLLDEAQQFRKSALYYILAGVRFNKINQDDHAYRCNISTHGIYKHLGWFLIEDHLNYTLGEYKSKSTDQLKLAAMYFSQLLKESQQPSSQQNNFLKEFLRVYTLLNESSVGEIMTTLMVPKFDQIYLLHNKSAAAAALEKSAAMSTDDDQEEQAWKKMEQELTDFFSSEKISSVRLRSNANVTSSKQFSSTVDEAVFVHVELFNPMQITLTLNEVYPKIEFQSTNNSSALNNIEPFIVEKFNEINLEPLESKEINFKLVPKQPGTLSVQGLNYTLCSVVICYKHFSKHLDRPSPWTITVMPPMPVLDLNMVGIPESLLSGEIFKTILEVSNRGNRPMNRLTVKISQPSFIIFGSVEQNNESIYNLKNSIPSTTNAGVASIENTIGVNNSLGDVSCQVLLQEPLGPGQSIQLPMWIRGDRVGKHTLKILFMYGSQEKNELSARTMRKGIDIAVHPSLRINAFTRPSSRHLGEFILGLEIENLQSHYPIQIHQITSVGHKWRIETIDHASLFKEPLIGKQTSYVYFKFVRNGNDAPSNIENKIADSIVHLMIENDLIPVKLPTLEQTIGSLSIKAMELEKTYFALTKNTRTVFRQSALQTQYPSFKKKQLYQLFSLYFTDDIDLCIFWSSPGSPKQGHHYIMGIHLGTQAPLQQLLHSRLGGEKATRITTKALFAQTVKEQKQLMQSLLKKGKESSPVRLVMKSVESYRHNFKNPNPCLVPITVKVANSSRLNSVEFHLELLPTDDKATSSAKSPQTNLYPGYWVGESTWTENLSPQEEKEYTFKIHLVAPGVYDLNHWKMHVTLDGTKFVQSPNLSHLLVVTSL